MNRTSVRFGTRRMIHGSAVRRVAAIIGSTAFLAPLMSTSPRSGTPPFIKKLSMRDQYSRALIIIGGNRFDNPVLFLENVANRFGLVIAEFKHDFAAGLQKR